MNSVMLLLNRIIDSIIKYMEFIYQLFNKNLTKFPYLFNLAYVQVTNIVKLID